jgi:hypothetical protein
MSLEIKIGKRTIFVPPGGMEAILVLNNMIVSAAIGHVRGGRIEDGRDSTRPGPTMPIGINQTVDVEATTANNSRTTIRITGK